MGFIIFLFCFFIVGILGILFLGFSYGMLTTQSSVHDGIIHLPPTYCGYGGSWDNITVCSKCKLHGLYEDAHPVTPCTNCGNKTKSEIVGRWIRTSPRHEFWKNEGYWKVAK